MQKLVGIDTEEALKRLMGNETLLMTVVRGLIAEFQEGRGRIVADLNEGDFAAVSNKVHRLKGVAANISANEIYELLAQMEEQAKAHDAAGAKLSFANIEVLFDQLAASAHAS
ncbi:MAG: Hpt domain-containing protein [Limnobacter sp.]|nr:Hpt domain-containing protein [Limnobacter sp.]